MSYGLQLHNDWDNIAREVDDEVTRARKKFPSSKHVVLAMAEESGELVRAALGHMYKPGAANVANVRKEAIQTIAMCVRILQEGDATIGLPGERR